MNVFHHHNWKLITFFSFSFTVGPRTAIAMVTGSINGQTLNGQLFANISVDNAGYTMVSASMDNVPEDIGKSSTTFPMRKTIILYRPIMVQFVDVHVAIHLFCRMILLFKSNCTLYWRRLDIIKKDLAITRWKQKLYFLLDLLNVNGCLM